MSDQERTARSFWNRARRYARQGLSDFRGVRFPEDPDAIGFSEITFPETAEFHQAVFEGKTSFREAEFEKGARFNRATFQAEADFARAVFREEGKFHQTAFSKDAVFFESHFLSDARFFRATFGDLASFGRVEVRGLATFAETTFSGIADFNDARFAHRLWLQRTTFLGALQFEDVDVGHLRLIDREGRRVRGAPSFRYFGEGEPLFRAAKEEASRRGDDRLAGEAYYAEQCARNWKRRRVRVVDDSRQLHYDWNYTDWRAWFELLFAQGVFGYGERPLRPLWWGITVIIVFAIIYATGSLATGLRAQYALVSVDRSTATPQFVLEHRGEDLAWAEEMDLADRLQKALYFSAVTFTTLGFGDVTPDGHWMERLAALEAMLGALLMATFVAALSRRYMR